MEIPTLLSFHDGDSSFAHLLLEQIMSHLPEKFYVHLSPGLLNVFPEENIFEHYGLHYKMVLKKVVPKEDEKNIRRLSITDLPAINELFAVSYPHNWSDSRMLETNKYYGYFNNEQLVGIAGIHVFSEEYRVAALGNITTHPAFRGRQIGYKLTSALCCDLQKCTDLIGLNVKADNEYAIKCYEKIGFEIVAEYDECYLKNDPSKQELC
jgi:ribosomal protein S18 acetylase RimI-like enzyme